MSYLNSPHDLYLTDDEFIEAVSEDDLVDDLLMDEIIQAMHDDWLRNLGCDLIAALKD